MTQEKQWQLVLMRDLKSDGKFVYAVRTTGVYCRPTCPSRRPQRRSVQFFQTPEDAERGGYRPCKRCRPKETSPFLSKIMLACKLIDENLEDRLTLTDLSQKVGLSPFHLHRIFKKVLGVTPQQYQSGRRTGRFTRALSQTRTVTDAIYEAGYGSSSRVYENCSSAMGMTPLEYRKHGEGVAIHFSIFPTELGLLLIAATEKGICSIEFGEKASALEERLRNKFSAARIARNDKEMETIADTVKKYLNGSELPSDLALDVRSTVFQQRVWGILRTIPAGETRSYSQVARMAGVPKAVRAVARACASNPVALAIPCHRVVRKDGSLTGYRWGKERKAQLLELEKASRQRV